MFNHGSKCFHLERNHSSHLNHTKNASQELHPQQTSFSTLGSHSLRIWHYAILEKFKNLTLPGRQISLIYLAGVDRFIMNSVTKMFYTIYRNLSCNHVTGVGIGINMVHVMLGCPMALDQ